MGHMSSVNRAMPGQMAVLRGGGSLALAGDLAEQLGMCNLGARASVEGWIVNIIHRSRPPTSGLGDFSRFRWKKFSLRCETSTSCCMIPKEFL